MRDKGTIGGLTTAASIWVTGCIGLGIGWDLFNDIYSRGSCINCISYFKSC